MATTRPGNNCVSSDSECKSFVDNSDYASAVRELEKAFDDNSKPIHQELQWLVDKQRFDSGASQQSLMQLVTKRIEELETARKMDNGIALQNLIGPSYSLEAAKLELKWLQEHVQSSHPTFGSEKLRVAVEKLSRHRYCGYPLQYILKSEYFGNIKLVCQEKVLIPRQDTADHVMHLLERLKTGEGQLPKTLKVLDLCCGSGCMGLLMAHSFPYAEAQRRGMKRLEIYGVDNSGASIKLARWNRTSVLKVVSEDASALPIVAETLQSMQFYRVNVLSRTFDKALESRCGTNRFHIIMSNPPYIQPDTFANTVSLSVRRFEPPEALIPPKRNGRINFQSDIFYHQIIDQAKLMDAKILLMETGDREQSERQREYLRLRGLEFNSSEEAASKSHSWATPLVNFGDKPRPSMDNNRQYGHRGFVVYTYRMDAAGWVGPERPAFAEDGRHDAM